MKTIVVMSVAAAVAYIPSAAAATLTTAFVRADATVPTRIGTPGLLRARTAYRLTASGIADLCTHCVATPLTFTSDGLPTYAYSSPFLGYPRDTDPYGHYGPGGKGRYIGLLLGTFLAAPTKPSDFFAIGLGTTFTSTSNQTLYALINDTYYADNGAGTGYSLTVAAVPESATWALLIAGFGMTGVAARRRRTARIVTA